MARTGLRPFRKASACEFAVAMWPTRTPFSPFERSRSSGTFVASGPSSPLLMTTAHGYCSIKLNISSRVPGFQHGRTNMSLFPHMIKANVEDKDCGDSATDSASAEGSWEGPELVTGIGPAFRPLHRNRVRSGWTILFALTPGQLRSCCRPGMVEHFYQFLYVFLLRQETRDTGAESGYLSSQIRNREPRATGVQHVPADIIQERAGTAGWTCSILETHQGQRRVVDDAPAASL